MTKKKGKKNDKTYKASAILYSFWLRLFCLIVFLDDGVGLWQTAGGFVCASGGGHEGGRRHHRAVFLSPSSMLAGDTFWRPQSEGLAFHTTTLFDLPGRQCDLFSFVRRNPPPLFVVVADPSRCSEQHTACHRACSRCCCALLRPSSAIEWQTRRSRKEKILAAASPYIIGSCFLVRPLLDKSISSL